MRRNWTLEPCANPLKISARLLARRGQWPSGRVASSRVQSPVTCVLHTLRVQAVDQRASCMRVSFRSARGASASPQGQAVACGTHPIPPRGSRRHLPFTSKGPYYSVSENELGTAPVNNYMLPLDLSYGLNHSGFFPRPTGSIHSTVHNLPCGLHSPSPSSSPSVVRRRPSSAPAVYYYARAQSWCWYR